MSSDLHGQMAALAKRLSREACALAKSPVGNQKISRKMDKSVVTETDRAIEAHILRTIAEHYPDHAVCAEESAGRSAMDRTKARYCWVIDPLDGTRNFVSGFPCFSTSIAVLDRGQPVVGVVLEHNLGSLYAATLGGGATLNDRPMHAGQAQPGFDLLVGVPSSKDPLTVSVLRRWLDAKGLVHRNLGSTALHLGMVAAGTLSAAFCKRCKIWDIAAGALLVTEAGGFISDPFGQPRVPFDLVGDPTDDLPILSAWPGVHQQLLDSIEGIGG